MRSDSYNFTHPFLRKIQSFEQDSICLIAQSQSHTYGELLDSTRNALNLLNDIKTHSVIGIIGDYDLATIAFFLACVEKGFIITPLSASLAPQDSKTKSRWVTGLKAQNLGNLDSIKTKTPTAEVSLSDFRESANLESSNSKIVSEKYGLQGKSQGSYLSGDLCDFSPTPHLSPQAELPKKTTQILDSKFSAMLQSYIKEGQIDYLFYNNTLHSTHSTDKKHSIIASLQANHTSGLILFSSGSTGKPKAIVHNLNTLLQGFLEKKPKRINILLFLMFDHIGGLNTLFNVLSLGACGITLKNRKDMQEIAKSIQDYKIALLPASPSLLHLFLLSNPTQLYDLSSLRLITYGTEKMSDSLLAKLKNAFPKVRFHQTFGASEIGITQTTTKENFIRLDNMEYKIVNNELFIKSHTNALGYLNSDNSVFDDKGYFATGDLVEVKTINGEEYIKIIGRAKEVINVGGEKVIPQEVEGVLLQIPFISDCVVYGESNAITGQSVSVKVVLDSNHYIKSSKAESANLDSKNTDSNTAEVFLSDFRESANLESGNSKIVSEKCGLQGKSQGSYLSGNDRSDFSQLPHLSPQAELPKETTQNLELKKYIRAFCKDKLAPFKIPSKVSIVESLEVSERFKKLRLTNGGGG
nr:fatty acid--CoA ligase family protein [uncultured Helicobacter sp.]